MGKITEEELALLSPEEREALSDEPDAKSVEELRAEQEAEAARQAKEDGGGAAVRNVKTPLPAKTDEEIAAAAVLEEQEANAAKEKADAEAKAKADADAAAAKTAETEEEKTKREADEAAAAAKAKEDEDAAAAEAATAAEAAAKAADEAAEVAAATREKVIESIQPKSAPPFVLEAEKKYGTADEIKAKISEIDAKFEDGDIKLAEYTATREEYVRALTEIDMFDKINTQVQKGAAEKGWKESQVAFFTANPEYSTNRVKNVAIVDAVNRILQTEESKTMTDAAIFKMAKEECDKEFYPKAKEPVPPPPPVKTAEEKKKEEDEAAEKKKEDEKKAALDKLKEDQAKKDAAVKTLNKVPVSESNQGDDKFDAIDKLTGEAFEKAVANLSDVERKAYGARA